MVLGGLFSPECLPPCLPASLPSLFEISRLNSPCLVRSLSSLCKALKLPPVTEGKSQTAV